VTFEQLDELTDKSITSVEKEIIKVYQESLIIIRSQLNELYIKYGNPDGTLTYSDMSKYGRLKSLEARIIDELSRLTGLNANRLKSALRDIYSQEYYHTGFIFETGAQVKLGYMPLDSKVIEASIQNPISGLTLSDTLAKNKQNVIIAIRQQITQGLVNGESYYKMSQRIKSTLEGDAKKAIRVAQTEAHRVQNEGREASYQHAESKGLKFKKIWTSSLSTRTRESHASLDGKIADSSGYFHYGGAKALYPGGFGLAKLDINCRCTTRAEFEGYESTERKDSEIKKIIPYTNYDEWYMNRITQSN